MPAVDCHHALRRVRWRGIENSVKNVWCAYWLMKIARVACSAMAFAIAVPSAQHSRPRPVRNVSQCRCAWSARLAEPRIRRCQLIVFTHPHTGQWRNRRCRRKVPGHNAARERTFCQPVRQPSASPLLLTRRGPSCSIRRPAQRERNEMSGLVVWRGDMVRLVSCHHDARREIENMRSAQRV